jgi:ribonuclease HI
MKKITIFTSGIAQGNPGPAAIGVRVIDARGTVVREESEAIGNASGTFAAYHAVLRGLQAACEVFGKSTKDMQVEVWLDSDLVKRQLNAEHQIKEPGYVPYFIEIHNLKVAAFPRLTFTLAQREYNKDATRLAKEALL